MHNNGYNIHLENISDVTYQNNVETSICIFWNILEAFKNGFWSQKMKNDFMLTGFMSEQIFSFFLHFALKETLKASLLRI